MLYLKRMNDITDLCHSRYWKHVHLILTLVSIFQKYPDNVNVQYVWMTSLLPSIMDVETSMQEKAVQVGLCKFPV